QRISTQPRRFLFVQTNLAKPLTCVNFICRGITVIHAGPPSERGYVFGENLAVAGEDLSGARWYGHLGD
ncbi:MAG: hypothetical protein G01um101477_1, partial [Candidatus Doudnabacteria bacterium Gr01-1014_77]